MPPPVRAAYEQSAAKNVFGHDFKRDKITGAPIEAGIGSASNLTVRAKMALMKVQAEKDALKAQAGI
jgi:hypothetical protein